MTDNTELKRLAEALIELNRTNLMDWAATVEDARIGKTHTEYALAANPAAVLFLVAENELLAKTADCWDRLNIQNKALSDSFRTERDELRAEVAGLKTGYEAYERVNAELKAEVGALRKLGPSKEIIWCACGDGYPVNSYGAGFMDANNGVCANCDAALGQGEQP